MADATQYMVKDGSGNVYGPASVEMLRQWVAENRVLGSMMIAPQGTEDWQLVSSHPELAAVAQSAASAPTDVAATTGFPTQPVSTPVNPYAVSQQPSYVQGAGSAHPLALWSMICGIASIPLTCICLLGIPAGIAAIIMGYIAMQKIKVNPALQGQGMAKAGIITGICGVGLDVILLVIYIIAFAMNPQMMK